MTDEEQQGGAKHPGHYGITCGELVAILLGLVFCTQLGGGATGGVALAIWLFGTVGYLAYARSNPHRF